MPGIILKEFKAADAVLLADEAVDDGLIEQKEQWIEWGQRGEYGGPAYTGYYKGVMVGAAGAICNKNGGCTLWLVFSKKIDGCKIAGFRMVRDMLKIFGTACEFRKYHALSRVGFDKSQRLLEHLGFVNKGLMKNKTHYLYVKG